MLQDKNGQASYRGLTGHVDKKQRLDERAEKKPDTCIFQKQMFP
jgi:hypothetical protein